MGSLSPDRITRWRLGVPAGQILPGEAGVAFTGEELRTRPDDAGPRVGFHEAMAGPPRPAPEVEVRLPTYRGKSFLPVLSWLITERLAVRGAEVGWRVGKQQGPASIAALLSDLGWDRVRRKRAGREVHIGGIPPATAELPDPDSFTGVLGGASLTFFADYGVFSSSRVDDGTAFLFDQVPKTPVDGLADIGVGYGPLAIGLLAGGVAGHAIATDVDCVALWLTQRNAAANGVAVDTFCTPDPASVPDTPLTVCNVPTHLPEAASTALMAGLARRARGGRRLLIVVHTSLRARYERHLTAAGLDVTAHQGPAHVVLDAAG